MSLTFGKFITHCKFYVILTLSFLCIWMQKLLRNCQFSTNQKNNIKEPLLALSINDFT